MDMHELDCRNVPPRTFTVSGVVIGMFIIMICIGLPIAYGAKKFLLKRIAIQFDKE